MEDGYASYQVFSGVLVGYFYKDGALPKNNLKPAIKTTEGWREVEEGKHYIVTGIKGERYPVEKEIFHELYDLVDDHVPDINFNINYTLTDDTMDMHALIDKINTNTKIDSRREEC